MGPTARRKPPIVCATEADCDAALTMQMFKQLAGTPVLFADVRHYHADLGVWDLCNSGEHATYFAGRSDDPAVNLARTEFRPQGFYFPAGGAAVYHIAAPGPVTLARLTRHDRRYRMTIVPREFVDFGARNHEIAALSARTTGRTPSRGSRLPGRAVHPTSSTAITSTASTATGLRELELVCSNLGIDAECEAANRCPAAIGLDFGTESVRALLVDVAIGRDHGDRGRPLCRRRHRARAPWHRRDARR